MPGSYYYGVSGATIALAGLLSLVPVVLALIAQAKMLIKAGEPWWAVIVPFYNTYEIFKISMGNGWKFLWLFVPFVNIYFAIVVNFRLANSFGKGTGFGFGLLLLPIVFYPILGFGSDAYVGLQG